jgi:hypothetical protein
MRDAGQIHFISAVPAGTPTSLASTGDKFIVTAVEDLNLYEFGIVVTTAITGGSDQLVLALDKRPIAGSDTNRGSGDIGTGTVSTSTNVAGDIIRKYISKQLKKGEQVVFEVTDAAAAGEGILYLKAYPAGEAKVSTHDNGAGTVTLTDRDFDA